MSTNVVKLIKISLIIIVGLLLTSCGDGDSGGGSPVTPTTPSPTTPPNIPNIDEAFVPSLSYSSTTFKERLINDGSVEGTLRIEISNDTFAIDVVSASKYQISNVPAGLTATLQFVSNTTLTLTLTGNAGSHAAADSLSNIGIEFLNGAFAISTEASLVTHYHYTSIGINYIEEAPSYHLEYSASEFNETAANNGTISDSVVITFITNGDATPDTFTGNVTSHIDVSNVPAGLTVGFNRDSDTQVTMTLNGTASSHGDSADISNLKIEFGDDAFTNQAAANITDSTKNLSVYFFDVELVYSGTVFNESSTNNGSIENSIEITLTGDTYSTDVANHVSFTNLPANLVKSITRQSANLLILTFTGSAIAHTNDKNINNLGITFSDEAFDNADAINVAQSSRSDLRINFIDVILGFSNLTLNEAAANNGSITDTIQITLTGDTFAADVADHVNVTNIPTGLSLNVTRISDILLSLGFSGNADTHYNSDDMANLAITFTTGAFSNAAPANVIGSSGTSLTINFDDTYGDLFYSTTVFHEDATNNGGFEGRYIDIALGGDYFTADVVNHISVTNVPAGLTAVFTRESDTKVRCRLDGNADNHKNNNDINNMTITFSDAAFRWALASNVSSSNRSDLNIDYDDTPATLTYSLEGYTETQNSGQLQPSFITVNLSGDTFTDNVHTYITADNIPEGLTVTFYRISEQVVYIVIQGTAQSHSNADDINNLRITFPDEAFTEAANASVTGANKDLWIDFTDVYLTYSSLEFHESIKNDGSINGTIEITLTGDTFDSMIDLNDVNFSNLPANLAIIPIWVSDTQINIKIDGKAENHGASYSFSDLGIVFKDSAFVNITDAANVENSNRNDLSITFIDLSLSYSNLDFTESALNDGSVEGTSVITLVDDTFTADVLNHITVDNAPAGLTTRLTRDSDTQLTLDFIGQALEHQNVNDVSNISISFSDAAFTSTPAEYIFQSTKMGFNIDFNNNASLSYSGTEFSENSSNDGSIINSITIDLTGDTFDADVLTNGSILISNLPSGLTGSFTRGSDTQLTLSLVGNANPHEISNSISNLTIEFLDNAFVNSEYASSVFGNNKNDLQVSFMDTCSVLYASTENSDLILDESGDANDGSFTETMIITVVGDSFSADVVSNNLIKVYNLPLGLAADFTRDSDTQVTMSLTGKADEHEKAHNVNNITVAFQDGAFVIKDVANVTDSTKTDLGLNFYSSVVSVSSSFHTCAVLAVGEVKCWGGAQSNGEHGRGDTLSDIGAVSDTMGVNLGPALLGTGITAKSVRAGNLASCAILDTNEIKCWGYNNSGMFGLEDTSNITYIDQLGDYLNPINLGTGRTVSDLFFSSINLCALLDDATLKCWGKNNSLLERSDTDTNPVIGDSISEMGDSLPTLDFGNVDTLTSLSVGNDSAHLCAILTDNSLKCWGENDKGQLGLGNTTDSSGDVDLGDGHTAKMVTTSLTTTCAILDDDSVKCWGDNSSCQHGTGDNTQRLAPGDKTILGDGRTAKSISTANGRTCAILDNDQLKCWGANYSGEAGIGDISGGNGIIGNSTTEMENLDTIDLGTGRTVKSISISIYGIVCAILDNDRLKCWGYNNFGQLGLEDTENRGDNLNEMGDFLPFIDL